MLLDAIATVILLGMMFIPLVNIIVGVVIGADLAGPPGALAISAAQKIIDDRRTARIRPSRRTRAVLDL